MTDRCDLNVKEWMKGHIGFDAEDFQQGYIQGIEKNAQFMFGIDIDVPSVSEYVDDPGHESDVTGYIKCDTFGGKLPITKGIINLFVDKQDSKPTYMWYRLSFVSPSHGELTMIGFKTLFNDNAMDMWNDLTTLYIKIVKGHPAQSLENNADVIARGIVRIKTSDFPKMLMSVRTPKLDIKSPIKVVNFGQFFMREIWSIYGK